MPRYNHMVGIAFSVISNDPEGGDFTPDMLRDALMRRIAELDRSDEWIEAVGAPDDTYEEDK